ncbi:dihydrodipicolinate synthase family protein [Azospirillum melinis]|uniref:Dihydrodipicolinate synthase family protein n=1 Tax=Azospirillum melinis TaxID=328839 RepID=A0ABX2KD56_9PROT|nr:dihydrodipicolinate synthase family protein [Azospirillum melinis]MBP2305261.1 4-hydroxy-tetrahydrodipicolinate synthase [Azospirillum melinis]NUA97728.1 dihydrodipicolinate synthase family protein [Azospirillum melinis]
MAQRIDGIIPVMLTPFTDAGEIDYPGLTRLIEWYLANGADALFAVCQSSEMQFLSLAERVDLAKFVVAAVAGRVPVVVSGHISDDLDTQVEELTAMAATGGDALVLVTNHLDPKNEGTEEFRRHLSHLLERLPSDIPLGLYECPAPYRRLLSDEELRLCIDSGRFVLLKDVSCDLPTVERRLKIAEGSGLAIINANAAIARDAMRAGSPGFTGVFTNIHPDLYRWMRLHGDRHPELADELATFLVVAAVSESLGYPAFAKMYHQRLGTFGSIRCRVIQYDVRERFWALDAVLDKVVAGTEAFRAKIAALPAE